MDQLSLLGGIPSQGVDDFDEETMAYYIKLTKSNYHLDEVVSALQKEIRRAHVYEAVYWAKELIRSGYSTYLWRRLFIIASEDIGLADDQAVLVLRALHESWLVATKKAKEESVTVEEAERASLITTHAVMRLARAPKNREVADANSVAELNYEAGERLEVPDYALDGHTDRGRKMGRGGDKAEAFFQAEGRKVNPEAQVDGNRFYHWLTKLFRDKGVIP